MRLVAVVPVLDEEARIDRCLASLARQPALARRIVVDGGSRDRTVERALAWPGVEVIEAPRGRARQQNAGARAAADADAYLFVHADTELPARAALAAARILSAPGVVAGAFRTRHRAERWRGASRILVHLADIRSRTSRIPYGDQAIFVGAGALRAVGGFPDMELMEDLELSRRLARIGRIRIAREAVVVSARRFEASPVRQCVAVNTFPALYALGVSPRTLARLYGDPR